jgi:hypothetical protein
VRRILDENLINAANLLVMRKNKCMKKGTMIKREICNVTINKMNQGYNRVFMVYSGKKIGWKTTRGHTIGIICGWEKLHLAVKMSE